MTSKDNSVNEEAHRHGCRNYRECVGCVGIKVTPQFGLDTIVVGRWMINTEHNGSPRCIAIDVDAEEATVHMWFNETEVVLSADKLKESVTSCIDRMSFVIFPCVSRGGRCCFAG